MLISTCSSARLGVLGTRGHPSTRVPAVIGRAIQLSVPSSTTRMAKTTAKMTVPSTVVVSHHMMSTGRSMPSAKTRPSVSSVSSTCQQRSRYMPQARRLASAASTAASAATFTTTTTATGTRTTALDWNTFFHLRKTRRRYQLACSLVALLAGAGTASLVLVSINMDSLSKLPLDPMFSLVLIVVGAGALGWLAGPSLGSTMFYLAKRGVKGPMATKEAEFFARIRKNRADPNFSSYGHPLPDYYGEKISSVAGYRQWLKDQRAFMKKRTSVS